MSAILKSTAMAAFSAIALLSHDAVAQGRVSSNTGSSLFSSGSSSFGGGPTGSAAGGIARPTIGGGFSGQGGFGQTGQGLGFGGQSAAGQNSGFVGRNAQDVSNFFNALNPMAAQGGPARANMSRRSMDRGRDANATQDARPPILVKVKLGFAPPSPAINRPSYEAEQRLNSILQSRGLADVSIKIEDGAAMIIGVVSQPGDLLFIDRLARLEPSVHHVLDMTEGPSLLPAPSR